MDITALAAFAPIVKVIDLYRFVFAGDEQQWKEAGYTVGAWVVGIGLVALVAGSTFAADLGLSIETWQDYVLTGITLGALGSVVHDAVQPEGVTIR
jgi:hypothetical protein